MSFEIGFSVLKKQGDYTLRTRTVPSFPPSLLSVAAAPSSMRHGDIWSAITP